MAMSYGAAPWFPQGFPPSAASAANAWYGAVASTDVLEDVTTLLASGVVEDDAVMFSVAAIRDSIQMAAEENRVSSDRTLNEMTRSQDPRFPARRLSSFRSLPSTLPSLVKVLTRICAGG